MEAASRHPAGSTVFVQDPPINIQRRKLNKPISKPVSLSELFLRPVTFEVFPFLLLNSLYNDSSFKIPREVNYMPL
jgi:hypothetical protein